MTTITTDRLEELADLEREAWAAYRDSLRDLAGADYEQTESTSWEELQRLLGEVEAERAELTAGAAAEA